MNPRKPAPTPSGDVKHVNYAIPAEAHPPLYLWHKYWTRKPHNVVSKYIEAYAPGENAAVLDPFSGSGVTAIEALRLGKKAIAIDISPIAIRILKTTVELYDFEELEKTFTEIEKRAKEKILELYLTKCRSCKKEIPFDAAIWVKGKAKEYRYKECPHCGDRREEKTPLTKDDMQRLKKIESAKIKCWHPKNRLYYEDGRPFMKKERFETVADIFTKRNLHALAVLMDAIQKIESSKLREAFETMFTSMAHLCSRMVPVRPTRPFSPTWTQQSYWSAPSSMEINVWKTFASAFSGPQGFLAGKHDAFEKIPSAKTPRRVEDLLTGKANALFICEDALTALRNIPDNSVDYVFTDPPYDASIQFGELSYMWACWLRLDEQYREIFKDEVVRNEKQGKNFDRYYDMLHRIYKEIHRVLKPGAYMTVTFHHPKTKVRNATIRAARFAGFDYQKIVYQPPARASAKSLMQPYGSAQGDFFFRYQKPVAPGMFEEVKRRRHRELGGDEEKKKKAEDYAKFEGIVVDSTVRVLAERGEATPYSIILSYIDPILAKHGYVISLDPDFAIEKVLKAHVGKEFALIETKMGGAKGRAWWFRDTAIVKGLDVIPLSERIEKIVYSLLLREGKISFTNALAEVWQTFPNSLTPDSQNVMDILKLYAEPAANSMWRLSSIARLRSGHHSEVLYMLAEWGKACGYKIWIGKREQREYAAGEGLAEGDAKPKVYLADLCDEKSLSLLSLAKLSEKARADVENMDILWYKGGEIAAVFEVENTTAMTESLKRGSHLPPETPKFMVLPDERHEQFLGKMEAPLFKEAFEEGKWKPIYYQPLHASWKEKRFTMKEIERLTLAPPVPPVMASKRKKIKEKTLFEEG